MQYLYSNEQEREEIKNQFKKTDNIDPNKKTILFSVPGETGTSYFRLFTPLIAMASKYPELFNYVYYDNEELPYNLVYNSDVWIQHRAGNVHAYYTKMLKLLPVGKSKPILIHDIDDNEIHLPPNHPMKDIWYATGKDKMAEYQLSNADSITTTTRNLKKDFYKYNNPENIKIFKNCFNWNLAQWKLDIPKREKITIGWAGLTSHFSDLIKMATILKIVHDKYPMVNFKIAGLSTSDVKYNVVMDKEGTPSVAKDNVTDEKSTYAYKVKELFKDFDQSRIEFIGVLPLSEYGKFYTLWDINLAYIEHNKFNGCKSEIKIVEGAWYNNINVYSNIGGYADFTNSLPKEIKKTYLDHCAVKTENPTEWVDAISFWIDNYNTQLRQDTVINAHKFVEKEYDIYNQVDERIEHYNMLMYKK